MTKLVRSLVVKPGAEVSLSDYDPSDVGTLKKKQAKEMLSKNILRMAELEYLLYAQKTHALLVVFQAMDAGGKDGTIRNVMRGLNPQSCRVTSFKVPTTLEREHDFLWRIHQGVPGLGEIGIFNRSHYEDVLVARVHKLADKAVWSRRYQHINDFERLLSDNNVKILKFFLHISKEEQTRRLQARLEDPGKNWKLSPADVEERKYWDDYMRAYEDAIGNCSTQVAPWFIIPSNQKWFRNLAVSQVIVEAMESMKLTYPKPSFDLSQLVIE